MTLLRAYLNILNLYKQEIKFKATNLHSKQGRNDPESIQSSTTPDPGYQWESDKLTADTTNESHKRGIKQ